MAKLLVSIAINKTENYAAAKQVIVICSVLFLTVPSLANANRDKEVWHKLYKEAVSYQSSENYIQAVVSLTQALGHAKLSKKKDSRFAITLYQLGSSYLALKQYTKAESVLRESVKAFYGLNSNKKLDLDVALVLRALGDACESQLKHDEAERFYKEGLAMQEKMLEPGDFDVLASVHRLADLAYAKGEFRKSEAYFKRMQSHGWHHPALNYILADICLNTGRATEANLLSNLPTSQETETFTKTETRQMIERIDRLALSYHEKGNLKMAQSLLEWAVRTSISSHLIEDELFAHVLHHLGDVLVDAGQYRRAEQRLQQALFIRHKMPAEDPTILAMNLASLATLKECERQYPQAEKLYTEAFQYARKLATNQSYRTYIRLRYAKLLSCMQGPAAATHVQEWLNVPIESLKPSNERRLLYRLKLQR